MLAAIEDASAEVTIEHTEHTRRERREREVTAQREHEEAIEEARRAFEEQREMDRVRREALYERR